MTDLFDSSDAVRTAEPLRFAQSVTFHQPMKLEHGGELPEVTVAYETYGELNSARDNAVLLCHALSGDSHVARHGEDDLPGWWDIMVGAGKPIDTNRWFVICPNILGGCRGSTGPNSVNPLTGRRYGSEFPLITVGDIVEVQRMLVEHLGIRRLRAVVGGSLGGHMALTWGVRHSDAVRGIVAIATSPRLTSQALAFDIVGRNAIRSDPDFADGRYYETGKTPADGLAIARMLGHITYLSRESMMQKFDAHRLQPRHLQTQFETRFSVGSYLAHQGDKFVERFDANSYITLTMAMDLFDLGSSPERLAESLRPSQCRWLLLSYTSDWLFPPFQSQQIVNALLRNNQPVSYCNVRSECGHDAFLLPNELPLYGGLVQAFLENIDAEPGKLVFNGDAVLAPAAPRGSEAGDTVAAAAASNAQEIAGNAVGESAKSCAAGANAGGAVEQSMFHHRRLDYDLILNLIPEDAAVLDLGCGNGGLLARLAARGHQRLVGIELDENAILACVRRGLDVVHADLNDGLQAFADAQFDVVVLSQTLQAVRDVERLVAEMLRVGKRAIVSFPNFAHEPLRRQLAELGRAPRVLPMQGYYWYNSPDVRFLSIADFEEFCRERSIRVHQCVAIDTQQRRQVFENANLLADVAIFVMSAK